MPNLMPMENSRYLSPYMISKNKIFTMDIPYTYIHVTHLIFCGRIFKHTILEIVYDEKEQKTEHMPIF